MHSINHQNKDHALQSLQRFQQGIEQAVQALKLNDVEETAKVIEETIIVAGRNGFTPGAMVEAAQAEKMAILRASMVVVAQIEEVAMGTLSWTEVADTVDELKAIVQPQSANGKLRRQFDYLPCFVQSKAFYDACQHIVDTIANDGKLYSMDTPSMARN